MTPKKDANYLCPVCLNLDFDRVKEPNHRSELAEYRVTAPFLKMKASAESADCLACGIIYAGLLEMQEEWEEPRFLLNDTVLIMDLRRGRSLRVTLANAGIDYTFEFYTISHEDNASIPAFGISRPVTHKLDLDTCLALATRWIKKCNEEHVLCSRPVNTRLPTRVIDVGLDSKSKSVCLKETKGSERDSYTSLSHCWGKKQIITTTRETLQDRKDGIKISDLPKTFRDAISITRGLGIRYIWIDSLCIIQDDRTDWEVESAKMADVYMCSQLNIAATHSNNGNGGCFAKRWSLDSLNQIELNVGEDSVIVPDDHEEGKYRIFVRNSFHVAHDHFTRAGDYASTLEHASPLLSRGWVFQERLLSVRTLHFHKEELIWECASGISCECSRLEDYQWGDPDGLLQDRKADQLKMLYKSINASTATEDQVLDGWLELVTEYCKLKLTKQTDRLPAISGLASRLASRQSGEYLAGLWSSDLPRALCWRQQAGQLIKHPIFRHATAANAPSWSWASIWNHPDDISGINYDLISVRGFVKDTRFQIQGFNSLSSSTNPFGIGSGLWLKIRAPLIRATVTILQFASTGVFLNYIKFGEESVTFLADCCDPEGRTTDVNPEDCVYCVLLGHYKHTRKELASNWAFLTPAETLELENPSSQTLGAYALVLIKVHGGSTYKRVGLLEHRNGPDWWEGAEICDMSLE